MNKVLKKQKVFYIIGIIFLIAIGFRPAIKQIEMTKVGTEDRSLPQGHNVYVQALEDIKITGKKTYSNYDENYQVTKGNIVSLYLIKDHFCRATDEKQCFGREQFKILSTQDDQILLKNYLEKNTTASRSIEFTDLNKDGIGDLLIFQGRNGYYRYINFYSAHEDKLLWQITDFIVDDFYGPVLNVKILNQSEKPATIVVYQPENSNKYSFYKSINTKYQVVKPTKDDWKNYWLGTSTWELTTRVVGFWFLLLSIFALSVLIFIILLILVIKATSKKLSNKAKK